MDLAYEQKGGNMRFLRSFVLVFLCLSIVATYTMAQGIREERPNLIGGELGGKAFFYNISYERYLLNNFGIGVGAMGLGTEDFSAGLFPVYAAVIPFGNNHAPYIAGGVTIATATVDWKDAHSTSFGVFAFGYQYQSDTGLFIRATINYIFKDEFKIILPGIAIGGSF